MSSHLILYTVLPFAVGYVLISTSLLVACAGGRGGLVAWAVAVVLSINIALGKNIVVWGASVPLGILPFGFLYLAIDLLTEDGDTKGGYTVAVATALAQLFFTGFVLIVSWVPAAPGDHGHQAIVDLFEVTPRVTLAGWVATAGAFANVWLFRALLEWKRRGREAEPRVRGTGQFLVRSALSTGTAQLVNTALFIGVAFMGRLENIGTVILVGWLCKLSVMALALPVLPCGRWLMQRRRSR